MLPKLTVTLRETNPDFEPRWEEGSNTAVNTDEYQYDYEIEVEVVQLNLNTGGMRVRYEWPNKNRRTGKEMVSRDIPIDHFYKHYQITPKT
jgi:hypothetical protein